MPRNLRTRTWRTITAFLPAWRPCSMTTTFPDFKLRSIRRVRQSDPHNNARPWAPGKRGQQPPRARGGATSTRLRPWHGCPSRDRCAHPPTRAPAHPPQPPHDRPVPAALPLSPGCSRVCGVHAQALRHRRRRRVAQAPASRGRTARAENSERRDGAVGQKKGQSYDFLWWWRSHFDRWIYMRRGAVATVTVPESLRKSGRTDLTK